MVEIKKYSPPFPLLHFRFWCVLRYNFSASCILNWLLNLEMHCFIYFYNSLNFFFIINLGCNMRHIRLKFEPSKIGHVIERNLLNLKSKSPLGTMLSKRSITQPLSFMNFQISFISLLLEHFLRFQIQRMGVFMVAIFS